MLEKHLAAQVMILMFLVRPQVVLIVLNYNRSSSRSRLLSQDPCHNRCFPSLRRMFPLVLAIRDGLLTCRVAKPSFIPLIPYKDQGENENLEIPPA